MVWSVVTIYNYNTIVITKYCRYQNPAPECERVPMRTRLADGALSPDDLCRETAPPTRPESSGEKLSFSHRNFAPIAPSREPVIVGRPGPCPDCERLSGKPARPDELRSNPGRPGPRAAATSAALLVGQPRSSGCRALLPTAPQG